MSRYSDRYSDRARESVGLAPCSQRVESREERGEGREQRVEGRGTQAFRLTRHSLRSWLVFDYPYPTQSVVKNKLKTIGKLQTARARLAGVAL